MNLARFLSVSLALLTCLSLAGMLLTAPTQGGTFTVLHQFDRSDGTNTGAALVQARDGNFYGLANGGAHHKGMIFRITPNGTFSVLYSFTGGTDGSADGVSAA